MNILKVDDQEVIQLVQQKVTSETVTQELGNMQGNVGNQRERTRKLKIKDLVMETIKILASLLS